MKGERAIRFVSALALLMIGLQLGSCRWDKSGASINDISWRETVTLASGERIAVNRHVRFRQEFALGGGFATAARYESASLEIVPSLGGSIRWTAPIMPFLLDRDPDNGEWVVIGGDDGTNLWSFNGKPCPPQWAFRLHDGVWYVQPVPTSLIGRKPNLLVDLRVDDDRNYSSDDFAAVAAERMARQLSVGDRIEITIAYVGVVASKQVQCGGPGSPRFTDKFMPERTNRPNFASFPRTW